MRGSMETRVEGLIKQLQEVTDKSVCVGFGVSGPEQVCAQQTRALRGLVGCSNGGCSNGGCSNGGCSKGLRGRDRADVAGKTVKGGGL
jgi:hypothetical protein